MTEIPPGNEPPPYPGQQPIPEPTPYQGQGQQYPPPAPGQPVYGGAFRPKHPQAIAVLILGIAAFVFCQFLGPVAWIMGNKALKEIDANPTQWDGRSEVVAGKILGIVSTVLLILVVLAFVAFFAFAIILTATGELEDVEPYSHILSAFGA